MAAAQAGAQVTVGTASSTTSGTTTTVTIPVTVATPAVTVPLAPAITNFAKFDATVGNASGIDAFQTLNQAFTTIALTNVIEDSAKGWNSKTNQYIAPVTGVYMVVSRIRFLDGTAPGTSYGQGVSTVNADGPYFLWQMTSGFRNNSVNFRLMQLNKGEAIELFAYVDSYNGAKLNYAELTIEQVQ